MTDQFRGTVRYFRPEQASGLAVIDLPPAIARVLRRLKQMKVRGVLNGVDFTSNVMPGGGPPESRHHGLLDADVHGDRHRGIARTVAARIKAFGVR